MIDQISQGIIDEIKAYVAQDTTNFPTSATVLIDTDFNIQQVPSYILPLIILEIDEAPNSGQLIGGATQAEWNWGLVIYALEPDPYGQTSYGTGQLKIVDDLQEHFCGLTFLAQTFIDVQANLNFTYAFKGINKAPEIEKNNKIIIGRKINFESVAFDDSTLDTIDSTSELTYIENDNIDLSVTTLSFKSVGEAKTFNIVSSNDWIITSDSNWLILSVASGTGNLTITATASANSGSVRTAIITVSGTDITSKTVTVTQAAASV
jgi:hypothetical protein